MTTRRWRSGRSGRAKLISPGRPDAARREVLVAVWSAVARGRSSEADRARTRPGRPGRPVSRRRWGMRWFRRSGGTPPPHLSVSAPSLSGRSLSFAPRGEIALSLARGQGVRGIARRLGRAPSTISRQRRRHAAGPTAGPTAGPSGGLEYRATAAQWHADRSARRPKPLRLARSHDLRRCVEHRPAGRIARPEGTVLEGAAGGVDRTPPWPPPAAPLGLGGGARSGSRTDCGARPRTTRPCASRTRRSVRPSWSRAGVDRAARGRPAFGLGGPFACRRRGPGRTGEVPSPPSRS